MGAGPEPIEILGRAIEADVRPEKGVKLAATQEHHCPRCSQFVVRLGALSLRHGIAAAYAQDVRQSVKRVKGRRLL